MRQCLLIAALTAGVAVTGSPIILGKSMSYTLKGHHIRRVAVGNSKIVKARVFGSNEVLITGMRVGTTMVRLWDGNQEFSHTVRVVDAQVVRQLGSSIGEGVIKVAMEFMEIDLASASELGIKWPESLTFTAFGQMQGSFNTSGINYSVSGLSAKTVLRFLMREGYAKTLANPELFVRVGEAATFHSGGEIPIPSGSHSLGTFYRKIEWKPFGLSIQVKPSSEDGYRILSDVRLDMSEISREMAVDGIPGISRRKIETKMEAVDGNTVVLSTLLKQSTSNKEEGIPLLASIPLLGALFSTSDKHTEKLQLVVAMTFSFLNAATETTKLNSLRNTFND